MTSPINNTNKNEKLLPPISVNKKTLVLDLDETLVHSQFIKFSTPSDVVIKIEVENTFHDIHVMVRPGVKEFLEEMEKLYEIVIFTASVSKYADPLLDIIDKKGLCPFRLFREHCTLINMTFVKDLQKLGRDLKNIVIVDNSPLSYALHPENGLPILTWFEDKTDKELFNIIPILKFLSKVPDVRVFIPQFVDGGDKINYDAAKIIINNYNFENDKHNNNKININLNRINKIKEGIRRKKNNSDLNHMNLTNRNKELYNNKPKEDVSLNNIIASVNPTNTNVAKKENSKIKFAPRIQKKDTSSSKNKNAKNYIKLDAKKLLISSNTHNDIKINPKNNKKGMKNLITEINSKKRKNYSVSGNILVDGFLNQNYKGYSINLNNQPKKNVLLGFDTPKLKKIIKVLDNKNNHVTKSVKYSKKVNSHILISNTNINKNNKSTNKTSNTKNSSKSKFQIFTSYTNQNPSLPIHKKQNSYIDFRVFEYLNKMNNSKNIKKGNNTVRINISLDNGISFNNKFNKIKFINFNSNRHISTTRGDNIIKHNNTNIINYSPTNKMKFNYSIFHNERRKFLNFKKFKYNLQTKQVRLLTTKANQNENNTNDLRNKRKNKSKIDEKKNKVKFMSKNQIELNDNFHKRILLTKINNLQKDENKKS